jgi:hypothetical protein
VALHIWGREQALSDAKNEVDDGVDREQQEPLPEPAAGADPVAGDAAGAGADTATAGEASPASARSLMLGANATPVAWLALLLVLIVAGAGFMARSDAQRREADLMQRIQALESSSGLDTTTFDQMRDNLERRIELELEGLSDREQRLSDTQQRALQAQQQELADALERLERIARDAAQDTRSELGQRVDTLQRQLQQQSQRISGSRRRGAAELAARGGAVPPAPGEPAPDHDRGYAHGGGACCAVPTHPARAGRPGPARTARRRGLGPRRRAQPYPGSISKACTCASMH